MHVVIVGQFQLTAARRRLLHRSYFGRKGIVVSTHSRSKAAAGGISKAQQLLAVSTHSRSKAAAAARLYCMAVTPKFQLTAARRRLPICDSRKCSSSFVSTHSRSKAAAESIEITGKEFRFQLTAARRRLPMILLTIQML